MCRVCAQAMFNITLSEEDVNANRTHTHNTKDNKHKKRSGPHKRVAQVRPGFVWLDCLSLTRWSTWPSLDHLSPSRLTDLVYRHFICRGKKACQVI